MGGHLLCVWIFCFVLSQSVSYVTQNCNPPAYASSTLEFCSSCDQHLPGARLSYLCLLCCPDVSLPPQVTVTGIELSPPVTFRLRAGSGPVFLSGQECYETSDMAWEDDEEEEEEEEEDEDEDEDADLSLEEIPIKQVKRAAPQRPTSIAKAQPSGQEPLEEGKIYTQT